MRIPPSYEDEFKRARLTFLHQRVFDPSSKVRFKCFTRVSLLL